MTGRPPSCTCGDCPKCRVRVRARERYQSMTPEERRAWVGRRNPEATKRNDAARHLRDREKRLAAMRSYQQTESGKAVIKRLQDAYRDRYPEKYAAHIAFHNALRDGKIARVSECSLCGKGGKAHGHHNDYSEPLVVVWVCGPCHRSIHRKLPTT